MQLRTKTVPINELTLFLSGENQVIYGGICALTLVSESFLNVEQIWLMCDFYGVAKKINAMKTEIELFRITFENGGDEIFWGYRLHRNINGGVPLQVKT